MRFRAILNKDGGTLRTMDLDAFCAEAKVLFAREGHELECRAVSGGDVEAELEQASRDEDVDVMLAGGGDGTISAAAAAAYKSGKPLAVLPAGTMNLFARALNMPLDLNEALASIARGQIEKIDIATANGRPFVHQFGVGIHARLVKIRNEMNYRDRVGKMVANLRAIIAAAIDPPRFEVELVGPDGVKTQTVSGIAVSNNPLGDGPIPVAARLDAGVLGVYVAAGTTTSDLFALGVDVFTGRWRDNALVSQAEVPQVTLRFPKRKRGNRAVVDGELIELEPSVTLKIHPKSMSVVRSGASA